MEIYRNDNGLSVEYDEEADDSTYLVSIGDQFDLIEFQTGPIPEVGPNGLTNEALLYILIHRTKILDGRFPCDENKRAIRHMEEALHNFNERTERRILRGVEGKNVV